MNDRFKRPFDLTVTVAALLLLSPFWLVLGVAIALAIRIEDRGPVPNAPALAERFEREAPGFSERLRVRPASPPRSAIRRFSGPTCS